MNLKSLRNIALGLLGLALILAIYRSRGTVAVDDLRELRG